MKHFFPTAFAIVPLLVSCDHIDAVGDKVNDLKDLRKESTQGIDGMKTGQILENVKVGPAIQDLPQTEFDAFIAERGRLNIVDFHADWCAPCKKLGPILSEVVEANSKVVRLGKINVDHARELAQEQDVQGIPDVRFYVDGHLVHKFVGGESKATIEKLIAEHTSSIVPTDDSAGQVNGGSDGAAGDPAGFQPTNAPNKAKPINEAMKPMEKNWLPPGMSQKK